MAGVAWIRVNAFWTLPVMSVPKGARGDSAVRETII